MFPRGAPPRWTPRSRSATNECLGDRHDRTVQVVFHHAAELNAELRVGLTRYESVRRAWSRTLTSLRAGQRSHLHPRVIEASAATEVREGVGNERGSSEAVARDAAPESLRQADGALPHDRCDTHHAVHFAKIVEHANRISLAEPTDCRVGGVHGELDGGARQLAERRADRALTRRRDE